MSSTESGITGASTRLVQPLKIALMEERAFVFVISGAFVSLIQSSKAPSASMTLTGSGSDCSRLVQPEKQSVMILSDEH